MVMHKLESVLVNHTHKYPYDFEIQTDHLIPAISPGFFRINKKKVLYHLKYRSIETEWK